MLSVPKTHMTFWDSYPVMAEVLRDLKSRHFLTQPCSLNSVHFA